jgi:hypothetical protein
MINVLIGYLIVYGCLAFIAGFCFQCANGYCIYTEEPFYFSPFSLAERTDLNIFGIIIMTIIHYILNPWWCIFMTLYYFIITFCVLVYSVTHK